MQIMGWWHVGVELMWYVWLQQIFIVGIIILFDLINVEDEIDVLMLKVEENYVYANLPIDYCYTNKPHFEFRFCTPTRLIIA